VTKKNVVIGLWAVILLSLALAIASSGMPTPLQSMEWEVLQSLQQDGVRATDVECLSAPTEKPHKPLLRSCQVGLADGSWTIADVQWFEDGSWRFASYSRP